MNGLIAFILGVLFGALIATGVSMTLKIKKTKLEESVKSGSTKLPSTKTKPPIVNQT
jgi:uncharacterized membrane protein YciS (DUF1049 family)